ncbi:MAG: hypothetical protein KGJ06_05485 [Pseudomonadota bacterium]|nr:hypothetical protein [Pseudomonadota bacterium]
MAAPMKNDPIRGFELLGMEPGRARLIAQHILSAAKEHIIAMPDQESVMPFGQPLHANLVSVSARTLKLSGLKDGEINILRKAIHPLDNRFYDGPDGDRFTFLLDGLEAAAGISAPLAKKYAPLFEHNGTHGPFKGIQTKRGRL